MCRVCVLSRLFIRSVGVVVQLDHGVASAALSCVPRLQVCLSPSLALSLLL